MEQLRNGGGQLGSGDRLADVVPNFNNPLGNAGGVGGPQGGPLGGMPRVAASMGMPLGAQNPNQYLAQQQMQGLGAGNPTPQQLAGMQNLNVAQAMLAKQQEVQKQQRLQQQHQHLQQQMQQQQQIQQQANLMQQQNAGGSSVEFPWVRHASLETPAPSLFS